MVLSLFLSKVLLGGYPSPVTGPAQKQGTPGQGYPLAGVGVPSNPFPPAGIGVSPLIRIEERVLATRRAVRLLRSRRTFLFSRFLCNVVCWHPQLPSVDKLSNKPYFRCSGGTPRTVFLPNLSVSCTFRTGTKFSLSGAGQI